MSEIPSLIPEVDGMCPEFVGFAHSISHAVASLAWRRKTRTADSTILYSCDNNSDNQLLGMTVQEIPNTPNQV